MASERDALPVNVRCFAVVRTLVGADSIQVAVPQDATVGALRQAIGEAYPKLVPLLPSVRIAVGHAYVTDDHVIERGDELALIPPVSGGGPDELAH